MIAEQQLLLQAMRVAAKQHNVDDDCEVIVTIADNEQIRELNRDYRDIDAPTDVLSFAYAETDEPEIIGGSAGRVLGDILISIDKVREQARDYGNSEARELSYLAVHGFLHLLGFDHIQSADKKVMRTREELIMSELDLAPGEGEQLIND